MPLTCLPNAPVRVLFLLAEPVWLGGERLPLAAHQAGINTGLVYPAGATLGLIPCDWAAQWSPQQWFPDGQFDALPFISQLLWCIENFRPQLIVPLDDLLVRLLAQTQPWNAGHGRSFRVLFERSFGDLSTLPVRMLRSSLAALAQADGVSIPDTVHSGEPGGVTGFAARFNYRCLIKNEHSAGGQGVFLSTSRKDFLDRVSDLTQRCIPFVVQREIVGRLVMRGFVAHEGRVLAGLTLEKLRCNPEPFGPSSVVRCTSIAQVSAACEHLCRSWRMSGFGSADFIVEAETGHAYLLEFNSRPITTMHLGELGGVDLLLALQGLVLGNGLVQDDSPCDTTPVALYPKEWLRDCRSLYLRAARNDVPWELPELVRHYADMIAKAGQTVHA